MPSASLVLNGQTLDKQALDQKFPDVMTALESALSAIQHRMNALGTRYDGAPTAEHHALADAIDRLRMLQRPRVRQARPLGEEFVDVLYLKLVAFLGDLTN